MIDPNTNHPLTLGTYEDGPTVCNECLQPIETAEDGVLVGELARAHRVLRKSRKVIDAMMPVRPARVAGPPRFVRLIGDKSFGVILGLDAGHPFKATSRVWVRWADDSVTLQHVGDLVDLRELLDAQRRAVAETEAGLKAAAEALS